MNIYKKLSDFSDNNRSPKAKSAVEKVAKFLLKSIAWFAGIALLLAMLFWIWLGDKITDGVFAFHQRIFWMTRDAAVIISATIIIAYTGTLTWLTLRALSGRNKVLTSSIAILLVAGVLGFGYYTRKEIFAPGKDLIYLCSPSSKGAQPRIEKTPVDWQTKRPCQLIDPQIAAIAQDIIDGKFTKPTKLSLESVMHPEFALSENGLNIVYKSAVLQNDLPVLFSGAGWDPLLSVADFLKPVTLEDVEKIKNHLRTKKIKEDADAKAEADRKAEEEKRKAEQSAIEAQKAKALAEQAEKERKIQLYKNKLEQNEDIKKDIARLEEEERLNTSRSGTRTVKVDRRSSHDRMVIHPGTYVSATSKLVRVYVGGKKNSIPLTSQAFAAEHSKGKKVEIAAEGCWFCEEEWATIVNIVESHRGTIEDFKRTQQGLVRELEELRSQVPELAKMTSEVKRHTKSTLKPTAQDTSGNVVIRIRFIDRDPPKASFEYATGKPNSNRVNSNSQGIYIERNMSGNCSGVNLAIEGHTTVSVCNMGGMYKVDPGKVYTIENNTGVSVYSMNVRH